MYGLSLVASLAITGAILGQISICVFILRVLLASFNADAYEIYKSVPQHQVVWVSKTGFVFYSWLNPYPIVRFLFLIMLFMSIWFVSWIKLNKGFCSLLCKFLDIYIFVLVIVTIWFPISICECYAWNLSRKLIYPDSEDFYLEFFWFFSWILRIFLVNLAGSFLIRLFVY